MINILIISDKDRLPEYKQYLKAEDISVLHATDSLDEAEKFINKAQVILLDVPMEDAQQFISALGRKKVPILAVAGSANMGFAVMEWGAAEMQVRFAGQPPEYFFKMVMTKIRSVSKTIGGQTMRTLKRPDLGKADKIIAVGSSTGGTDTVEGILRKLPEDMPPILIVQHMPPIFTRMFAERLNTLCKLSVWEARDSDILVQGLVLIAPGDRHMVLARSGRDLIVNCTHGAKVCNQRPAVDVLFESIAKVLGNECRRCLGIILTGMGNDGAKGLLAMRNMGSMTIGQDQESSVVYGMPRAAYECGAVTHQLHLNDIAPAILNFAKG